MKRLIPFSILALFTAFLVTFLVFSAVHERQHKLVNGALKLEKKGPTDKTRLDKLRSYLVNIELISRINKDISYTDAKKILDSIKKYNKDTGLDDLDLLAICSIESRLNKKAVGPTEDYGLCQININTYYEYCQGVQVTCRSKQDLLDIEYNIKVAARLLQLHKKYYTIKYPNIKGRLLKAHLIASYNVGPYPAIKLLREHKKTKYLKKVQVKKSKLISHTNCLDKSFETFL